MALRAVKENTGEHKAVGVDEQAVYVMTKFAEADRARAVVAMDWLMNKLFVRGTQWVDVDQESFNAQTFKIVEPIKPSWKKRVSANLMFDARRVLVGRLTAQHPMPSVTPTSSDEEDRAIARECEQLLEWIHREKELSVEEIYLAIDLCETGLCWAEVSWDPTAGDWVKVDEAALAVAGVEKPEPRRAGDLVMRQVSPFEMFIDPSVKRYADARWILRVQQLPIDLVHQRWPDTKDMTLSEGDWNTTFGGLLNNNVSLNFPIQSAENMVAVFGYWEKQTREYPKGRYIVVAGNNVVESYDELPGDEFPFLYCTFDPDPDTFYGTTPMSFARAPQKEINQNLSLIAEGRNKSVYGFFISERGAEMSVPTGAPGEHIEYNGTAKEPKFVQPEPISQQIFQMNDLFDRMMLRIMGLDDPAAGGSSQGASGRAVLFKTEEANTRLGPTLTMFQSFLKRIAIRTLNVLRDNATEPLMYAVTGANASGDIKEFMAHTIRFRDVEVSIDSMASLNKQARRDQVMQLVQAGLVTQEQGIRLLEMGEIEEVLGSRNLDRQRARDENRTLYDEPVTAEAHEDHAVHIETHITEMKQSRWYRGPQTSKQFFRDHLQQHAFFVQGGQQPVAEPPQDAAPGSPQPTPAPDVPGNTAAPTAAPAEQAQPAEAQSLETIRGTAQ